MFLDNVFTACSLLHLTAIAGTSLCDPISDQTLFNVEWVYFKAIVCIWFLAVIPASAGAALYLIAPQASQYVWALLTIAVLFTVIVSYVIITLNMKRKVPSYSSGAMSSERTLFLAHLLFFPFFRRCPCNNHKIARFIR